MGLTITIRTAMLGRVPIYVTASMFVMPTPQTRPFHTGFCGPSGGPCKGKSNNYPHTIANGSAASMPSGYCAYHAD